MQASGSDNETPRRLGGEATNGNTNNTSTSGEEEKAVEGETGVQFLTRLDLRLLPIHYEDDPQQRQQDDAQPDHEAAQQGGLLAVPSRSNDDPAAFFATPRVARGEHADSLLHREDIMLIDDGGRQHIKGGTITSIVHYFLAHPRHLDDASTAAGTLHHHYHHHQCDTTLLHTERASAYQPRTSH